MSKATQLAYLDSKGTRCPACNSNEIEGMDSADIDKGTAWQAVCCLECEAQWSDVYKLIEYTDLERDGVSL